MGRGNSRASNLGRRFTAAPARLLPPAPPLCRRCGPPPWPCPARGRGHGANHQGLVLKADRSWGMDNGARPVLAPVSKRRPAIALFATSLRWVPERAGRRHTRRMIPSRRPAVRGRRRRRSEPPSGRAGGCAIREVRIPPPFPRGSVRAERPVIRDPLRAFLRLRAPERARRGDPGPICPTGRRTPRSLGRPAALDGGDETPQAREVGRGAG